MHKTHIFRLRRHGDAIKHHIAAKARATNNPCASPEAAQQIAQSSLATVYAVGNTRSTAQTIAQAVQNDNQQLATIFGLQPKSLPFTIFVEQGVGGAYHCGCQSSTFFVDADSTLGASFNAAEMVEVYEAEINNGWNCGLTNGEALSRVLAVVLHPELAPDMRETITYWWQNGANDYISTNDEDDRNEEANGCGLLFLYYLHFDLQYDWSQIIHAGGDTLAATYAALTNKPASTAFDSLMQSLRQFVDNQQQLNLPPSGNPWTPYTFRQMDKSGDQRHVSLDGQDAKYMRHLRRYSSHQDAQEREILRENRLQRYGKSHGHAPFRPLPAPTGVPPYHLDLATILSPDQIASMKNGMAFHITGDTGGIKNPNPQKLVATRVVQDLQEGNPRPAFFYHLGDVVYFYGETDQYYGQFYEPYAGYNAPIFAVPGNHDGDLSPKMEDDDVPSLQAFVNNFCQRIPHHTREALDETRSGMTQPNVYWTLKTPLVTIIGLYTNVPEGGRLDDSQISWLQEELTDMKGQGPLIVAMHHPIYSLESIHSGSVYMGTILDKAIELSGRIPDLVLAGHVHNYQRFTRQYQGYQIPYVVAGGGGYHNLHRLPSDIRETRLPYTDDQVQDVQLETFCDDQYGFLRLEITPQKILRGQYVAVPGFQDPNVDKVKSTIFDSFELDLNSHRIGVPSLAGARI